MLKKWKKTIQLLATTIIVLIYVTIGLFNSETLKGEEKKKKPLSFIVDSSGVAFTTDKYWGNVKTVVGYSREFRLKEELQGRIECEAVRGHPNDEDRLSTGRWRHQRKLGIKIFSAYYDRRQGKYHHVRIIGLLPRNSSFYCQMWYEHNETTTFVTQKAVIDEIWSADWGPKTKTCEDEYPAIISCLTPSQSEIKATIPSWVTFVDKYCNGDGTFIKITPPPRRIARKNFVVCVKPLNLSKISKKTFLEWIDINHRLGAEEIVIYGSNLKGIDSVLHKRREIVVRKEFESPLSKLCPSRSFDEHIWYKRKLEIIAYNDCFYSNLYHAKFVIPLDLDEIIVPKTGNNWFEAFRSHFLNGKLQQQETKNFWPEDIEHYASFSVRNAYFFSEYPKDAIIRSLMLPKRDQNVPKKLVNDAFRRSLSEGTIFDRNLRSCRLSPKSDSVKSFVHVSKTLSLFNHFAFHVLGEATRQFIFPENVFQLNHYRNSCDPILIDGCQDFLNCVLYDESLNKFKKRNFVRFKKDKFRFETVIN